MSWIDKLQSKWNLKNTWQVIIVLIVFACTGFTVMFLRAPVIDFFVGEGERSTLFNILYFIFIFPIYNIILLAYGFVFGQFRFFWEFEKKTFNRIFRRK
ncbi:MAG: prolipoprotein diacylglyceryl transferase [Cyclobacteriaceae bacterium]